ncbi:MAG: hypothetical protein FWH08_01330 [Oscillospiraceae bacterium]|nr:hypothetical protein [Oscillospiraceae bacterium]
MKKDIFAQQPEEEKKDRRKLFLIWFLIAFFLFGSGGAIVALKPWEDTSSSGPADESNRPDLHEGGFLHEEQDEDGVEVISGEGWLDGRTGGNPPRTTSGTQEFSDGEGEGTRAQTTTDSGTVQATAPVTSSRGGATFSPSTEQSTDTTSATSVSESSQITISAPSESDTDVSTEEPIRELAEQAPLVLSAPAESFEYGTTPELLSLYGGSGVGVVTFTSSNPDVISVSSYGRIIFNAVGTATIFAEKTGDNDFLSAVSNTITIVVAPRNISNVQNMIVIPINPEYNGSQHKVTVTDDDLLKKSRDLIVTYERADGDTSKISNVDAGEVSFTVSARTGGFYEGAFTGTFVITPRNLENADIKVNGTYTYNSLAHTPTATDLYVTDNTGGRNIIIPEDWDVSEHDNNINAGEATVTITAVDGYNYHGTATQKFTIGKATRDFEFNDSPSDETFRDGLTLGDIPLPPNYEWADPDTPVNAGDGQEFEVIWKDPDSNHEDATGGITIDIAKAAPRFDAHNPDPITITFKPGLTLADVPINGDYAWVVPTTPLTVADSGNSFDVNFTHPSGNYETGTGTINVIVSKADREFVPPENTPVGTFTDLPPLTLDDIPLPPNYEWVSPDTPVFAEDNREFEVRWRDPDGNYNDVTDTITIDIAKGEQSDLTYTDPGTVTYGDVPFDLDAKSEGSHSTAPLRYEVIEGSATVSVDGTVIINGAGRVRIRISRDGDDNWEAADDVIVIIDVEQRELSIADGSVSGTFVYNGEKHLPIPGLTDDNLIELGDWEIDRSRGDNGYSSNVNAGTAHVYIRATDGGNYTCDGTLYIPFTIDKAQLTVNILDMQRDFGNTAPTQAEYANYWEIVQNDFITGEDRTSAEVTGSPLFTLWQDYAVGTPWSDLPLWQGEFIITAETGTLSAPNYNFTFNSGRLTVGQSDQLGTLKIFTATYDPAVGDTPDTDGAGNTFTYNTNLTKFLRVKTTTTGVVTGGDITFSVTAGSDVITIDKNTGEITILKAGIATIVATMAGDDDFRSLDSLPLELTIERKPIDHDDIIVSVNSVVYNGEERRPRISVWDNGLEPTELVRNSDYQVTRPNSMVNADSYEIKITGIGNYDVDNRENLNAFVIQPKTLTITVGNKDVQYGLPVQNSDFTITDVQGFVSGEALSTAGFERADAFFTDWNALTYTTLSLPAEADPRVVYQPRNRDVGAVYHIIPEIENIKTPNYRLEFVPGILTVTERSLEGGDVNIEIQTITGEPVDSFVYNGLHISSQLLHDSSTHKIIVTVDGEPLTRGRKDYPNEGDFHVEFFNDVEANMHYVDGNPVPKAEVRIVGRNNYALMGTLYFNITPAPLTIKAEDKSVEFRAEIPTLTATYNGLVNIVETGPVYREDVIVTGLEGTLKISADYTAGESGVGTPITIKVEGYEETTNYNITFESGTLTVTRRPLSSSVTEIKVTNAPFYYNANEIKPLFEVWDDDVLLERDKDYTVVFIDNTAAGTAKIRVTGTNNYMSSVEEEFEILQADPNDFPNLEDNGETNGFNVASATNTIVYGNSLNALSFTGGLNDHLGGGSWAWGNGATLPQVHNTGFTATFTPTDQHNFDWTQIDGHKFIDVPDPADPDETIQISVIERTLSVDVEQAPLTITANDRTVTFGETEFKDALGTVRSVTQFDFPTDVTFSGFVTTDDENDPESIIRNLVIDTDYERWDDADDYVITLADGEADNYAITHAPGTLTVKRKSIEDADVTVLEPSVVFNGQEQEPEFTVTVTFDDGYERTLYSTETDLAFTVVGTARTARNVNVYDITITGVGNYIETVTPKPTFEITSAGQEEPDYDLPDEITYGEPSFELVLDKGVGNPVITVESDDDVIQVSPDFTDNGDGTITVIITVENAGDATVIVEWSGDENHDSITVEIPIMIKPLPLNSLFFKSIQDFTYNNTEHQPVPVLENDYTLEQNTDWTLVDYQNNKNAGLANAANPPTVIVEGTGNYTGKLEIPFNIAKAILTVTPHSDNISFSDNMPELAPDFFGYEITGFVNGEKYDSKVANTDDYISKAFNGAPVLSSDYDYENTANGQRYDITASNGNLTAVNYDFAFVDGELSINQGTQVPLVVTADGKTENASFPYVTGGTIALGTTGGSGTGAVTYSVTAGDAISVSGNTATISGVGTVTVRATKAGDDNFALTFAEIEITITPRAFETGDGDDSPFTVTINTLTYNAEKLTPTITVFDNGRPAGDRELIEGVHYRIATDDNLFNAGNHRIKIIGIGNYLDEDESNALEEIFVITPARVVVSVSDPAPILFRDPDPEHGDFTANFDELKGADAANTVLLEALRRAIDYQLPSFAPATYRAVGEHPITPNVDRLSNAAKDVLNAENYTFAVADINGKLVVNTRPIPDDENVEISIGELAVGEVFETTYTGDEIMPLVTVAITVNGTSRELVETVDFRVEYDDNTNVTRNASDTVIPGGKITVVGIGNYEGSSFDREFKILPKTLFVDAMPQEITYGNPLPAFMAERAFIVDDDSDQYNIFKLSGLTGDFGVPLADEVVMISGDDYEVEDGFITGGRYKIRGFVSDDKTYITSALSGKLSFDVTQDNVAYVRGHEFGSVGEYDITPCIDGLTANNYALEVTTAVLSVERKDIASTDWVTTTVPLSVTYKMNDDQTPYRHTPEITVTDYVDNMSDRGNLITENDFEVVYGTNTQVGEATWQVRAKRTTVANDGGDGSTFEYTGNYYGEREQKTFEIKPADPNDVHDNTKPFTPPEFDGSLDYGELLSEIVFSTTDNTDMNIPINSDFGGGSWEWLEPNTIPTVENSGYTAVFTPYDQFNFNWASFNPTGFEYVEVDDNGKITHTIHTTVDVTVNPRNLSLKDQDENFVIGISLVYDRNPIFDGLAHNPTVTLNDHVWVDGVNVPIIDNTDYTVTIDNNTNRGTATVSIAATAGNYTGERTTTFVIMPQNINSVNITAAFGEAVYDHGNQVEPSVTLNNTVPVEEISGFTLAFDNNVNVGPASVTITMNETGTNNYTGTRIEEFQITPFVVDDIIETGTGQLTYGEPLSFIPLSRTTNSDFGGGRWFWAAPATNPQVADKTHTALFIPHDTHNYDWSNVAGYKANTTFVDPEVSGETAIPPVVIERALEITVNRATLHVDVEVKGEEVDLDGEIIAGSVEYGIALPDDMFKAVVSGFVLDDKANQEALIPGISSITFNHSYQWLTEQGGISPPTGGEVEPIVVTPDVEHLVAANYTIVPGFGIMTVTKRELSKINVTPLDDVTYSGDSFESAIRASITDRAGLLDINRDLNITYVHKDMGGNTIDLSDHDRMFIDAGTIEYTISASATGRYQGMPLVTQTLKIKRADQQPLIVENIEATYGDTLISLYTPAGGSGTGEVTFVRTVQTPRAGVPVGSDVIVIDSEDDEHESHFFTVENAGTATITVTKAGDNNFNSTTATITVTVSAMVLDLSMGFEPIEPFVYTGMQRTVTTDQIQLIQSEDGTGGLIGGTDFAIMTYQRNTNARLSTDANPPSVTIEGRGNYSGTVVLPFTIEQRPVWLLPNLNTTTGMRKTFGATEPTFGTNYTLTAVDGIAESGLVSGHARANNMSREAGEDVGHYMFEVGGVGINSGMTNVTANYIITMHPDASLPARQFEITTRNVIITPNNQSKDFGDGDPELTYTSGTVTRPASDVITGNLGRVPGEAVGTYQINLGNLSWGANYNLTLATTVRNLTITARTIEVDIDTDSLSPTGNGILDTTFTPIPGDDIATFDITVGNFAFADDLLNQELVITSKNPDFEIVPREPDEDGNVVFGTVEGNTISGITVRFKLDEEKSYNLANSFGVTVEVEDNANYASATSTNSFGVTIRDGKEPHSPIGTDNPSSQLTRAIPLTNDNWEKFYEYMEDGCLLSNNGENTANWFDGVFCEEKDEDGNPAPCEYKDAAGNHIPPIGLTRHYVLVENINNVGEKNGIGWRFTGSFDGAGHVIRNLTIEVASSDTSPDVGMFRSVGENDSTTAYVRRLGLVNVYVNASKNGDRRGNAGVIAGNSYGIIEDVFVQGRIISEPGEKRTDTQRNVVGGIAGRMGGGQIRRSVVLLNEVMGQSSQTHRIVGEHAGTLTTENILSDNYAFNGTRTTGFDFNNSIVTLTHSRNRTNSHHGRTILTGYAGGEANEWTVQQMLDNVFNNVIDLSGNFSNNAPDLHDYADIELTEVLGANITSAPVFLHARVINNNTGTPPTPRTGSGSLALTFDISNVLNGVPGNPQVIEYAISENVNVSNANLSTLTWVVAPSGAERITFENNLSHNRTYYLYARTATMNQRTTVTSWDADDNEIQVDMIITYLPGDVQRSGAVSRPSAGGAMHGTPNVLDNTTDRTPTSLTINASSLAPATSGAHTTGQSLQFAISTLNNAHPDSLTWRTWAGPEDRTFSGLNSNTQYFIYARTAMNNTHSAGVAAVSAAISTRANQTAGAIASFGTVAVAQSTSANSMTLNQNAVTLSNNTGNQVIEYAISSTTRVNNPTVDNLPADLTAWQEGRVFAGLQPDTQYHVYARSKENTTRFAGAIVVSPAEAISNITLSDRAAGATLALPTTATSLNSGAPRISITLPAGVTTNAAGEIFHSNGQQLRYAVVATPSGGNLASNAPAANSSLWMDARATNVNLNSDGTTLRFNNLEPGTRYVVFVEAQQNATRNRSVSAGREQVAEKLTGANVTVGVGATFMWNTSGTFITSAAQTDDTITVTLPQATRPTQIAQPTNRQNIQYAFNTSNSAPSATSTRWQDSNVFTDLEPHRQYFFFARTGENDTYKAGEASSSRSHTTARRNAVTPPAPTLATQAVNADNTGITVTLTEVTAPAGHAGVQYGRNTGNDTNNNITWQNSRVFNNVTAGGTFRFYIRYTQGTTAGTARVQSGQSAHLAVATISLNAASVPAPSLITTGNNAPTPTNSGINVRLSEITPPPGRTVQYAVRESNSAPSATSTRWQDSRNFSLEPNTEYFFFARYPAVGATPQATSAGTAYTTGRAAGAALRENPTGTLSGTSLTVGNITNMTPINANNNGAQSLQYALAASRNETSVPTLTHNWQATTTFSNLNAGTTYFIYARTAANTTHSAGAHRVSAAGGFTVASTINTPTFTSQTISNSAVSVTIGGIAAAPSGSGRRIEYSRSNANQTTTNGTWGTSATFTGLQGNTTYTFFARYALTATPNTNPIVSSGFTYTTPRRTGSTISRPAGTGGEGTITVTTASSISTGQQAGQSIEYAVNTSGTITNANSLTWQPETTFTNVAAGSYFIYARTAENSTHAAGELRVSSSAVTVTAPDITLRVANAWSEGANQVTAQIENTGITSTHTVQIAITTGTSTTGATWTNATLSGNNTPPNATLQYNVSIPSSVKPSGQGMYYVHVRIRTGSTTLATASSSVAVSIN